MFFFVEKQSFPTVFNTDDFPCIECGKLKAEPFQWGENTLQPPAVGKKRKENGSTFF